MLISTEAVSVLSGRIKTQKETFCKGLYLSARFMVLNQAAQDNLNFIILPTRESAEYCSADLYNLTQGDCVFFLPESGRGVEKSNYKSTLAVQRTAALDSIFLADGATRLYIVSYPEALEELIPSRKSLEQSRIHISKGMEISHAQIIEKLSDMGFERVDFVSYPGQYAIRGSLVDIFSYSNNEAYRISFWGNEVEKIDIFNCNTQLSKEEVQEVDILSNVVEEQGSESILSQLPSNSTIWLDSAQMYSNREFYTDVFRYTRVFLDTPVGRGDEYDVLFHIAPQPVFNKNFELLVADIQSKLLSGYKVTIIGEKQSQLNKILGILENEHCHLPELLSGKNLHEGFIDHDDKVCIYTDHEIFDRFHRVTMRRSVEKTEQLTLNDLNSFNIGDYVVHIDHGVGIFGGLVRIKDDFGRMKEVVKLTYKDGDVVFVSVHALHKISRFRSKDGEPPKIHNLGSKSWTNLKSSAKSRVKDIAKELIQLYAKRRASKGYAFSPDSYLQDELETSFMFEDTPDQEQTTKAVKRDMEDTCPMDRLVCGDVGFGKTEIAVRAAFKAATDGKQVAVLVPTTILALQHYKTFSSRLSNFACNVDYVSRLRTAKEISAIKEKLKNGQIDILIGTHKILSSDFEFKDLGLLIIDEEQKFGVSAKEKLRQYKVGIDTLTLTATPIPRTLQFSLLGARDLSIINTPPPNRIPVQTEIILFDEKEIRSIINYELQRGGQVFFLHNRVEELASIEEILHRLIPQMRICVAHGQMEPKVLENKMLDFMAGEYDLLLCTTIVENGLDIPNANTIIVNQAQNIGLSDLHQIRGRVGRSNKKAFCYLIVPPLTSITEDARKRLKAIEEFSDLGSGFNIAMQDLDIRGAGNLLGAEQSGFISDLGYETYQKILAEAMEEIGLEVEDQKAVINTRFTTDCTIETDQRAHIMDEYLDITAEKIRIYKQLDAMRTDKEIDLYKAQIIDRFGPMPEPVENLFSVVKLRNLGSTLGFEKIIVKNGMFICFFPANQMSPYYKSAQFASLFSKIPDTPFEVKQSEGKLKIITRGISSIEQALNTLKKLQ